MGLVSGLLLLPLAPVRGVAWVTEILAEEAERELAARNDPGRRLAEVDRARARGELSDEEATALEEEIIASMLPEPERGDEVE